MKPMGLLTRQRKATIGKDHPAKEREKERAKAHPDAPSAVAAHDTHSHTHAHNDPVRDDDPAPRVHPKSYPGARRRRLSQMLGLNGRPEVTAEASQTTVSFLAGQQKEVGELKQLLASLRGEREATRRREIVKRVVACMTQGIDVSSLFADMIMAIETKDMVTKKLVYLYLSNYAHSEPDLTIMCINTLRRECESEDPLVRGLALRSLCNLRLESMLEYVQQPLQNALNDISAYVRKTAVMAVLKIHYLSPSIVESHGYLHSLHEMLQDSDAKVVTNAIHVIDELRRSEGGIEVTQPLVVQLLNRIGEFSEFGLSVILDLVARYSPSSEEEMFSIMNLLDPLLHTASSGSVLATANAFFKLTQTAKMPQLHAQILVRAKPSLLTLLAGAYPEAQYVTLKHLQSVLHLPMARGSFDEDYRQFFIRDDEPPHIKHLKVELLPFVVNTSSARDVAAELGEYVTDGDEELARRAVRALGEIATRVPQVCEEMARLLVMLLTEIDAPYIRAEVVKALCDVVRVHSPLSELVLPSLSRSLKKVDEEDAKAAVVWFLGEFGAASDESPYAIESLIDGYEEEKSVAVKLQLLTAAVKLFFHRPPEMQRMLGRLFKKALSDSSNQDLHDRALLYYRLLSTDVSTAALLFARSIAHSAVDGDFAENKDVEFREKLFAEFNTLSVIFDMPSSEFIDENHQLKFIPPKSIEEQEIPPSGAELSLSKNTDNDASSALDTSQSLNLIDYEDSPDDVDFNNAGK